MKIRFSHIQRTSYVDGPGRRTVLFMQGCPIHCYGCQNKALWNPNGGHEAEADTVASVMSLLLAKDGGRAVTISGGEPFYQPAALLELLTRLRFYGVQSIVVYTGFTWSELIHGNGKDTERLHLTPKILPLVDTIVDGRFRADQDDPLIAWRGSRNQRPIAVRATLNTGLTVQRDWDKPVVTVTPSGEMLFPVGLSGIFQSEEQEARTKEIQTTRRCGETRTV